LPSCLIEEFESEPQNYDMIGALHSHEHFEASLSKWKELGVLHTSDITKNSKDPIERNLRISENSIGSGFGQVDRNGKLQGLGREVNDFIYEGQFKNDVYHGWGRFISHRGVYWGYWTNGLRNGQGKFVSSDGSVQEGNWVMGVLR
jgi:hypothetical protein